MTTLITIETWVSFPGRVINDVDGLRVEFSIPVHADLLPLIGNPEKKEITCKYRVRKGFKWGQLGRNARLRLTAELITGPKGGQHLHCKLVEIQEGQPIRNKVDSATKRMVKRMEKATQLQLPCLS